MFRFRLIRLLIFWFLGPKKGLLETQTLKLKAWPVVDVDVTRMFAHAFTRAMVFGRYQLIFGSEFRDLCFKNRWSPVVTADMMNIYRAINVFETFEVNSRLVGWDDRKFYAEQVIKVQGRIRARCLVEGVVSGPEGYLNPVDVFKQLGENKVSPVLSEEFIQWISLRRLYRRE